MEESFILDMEVRRYLIFERIWIGTFELYIYGNFGAHLYHSGDERYYQSFF